MRLVLCSLYDLIILKYGVFFMHYIYVIFFKYSMVELNLHSMLLLKNLNLNNNEKR